MTQCHRRGDQRSLEFQLPISETEAQRHGASRAITADLATEEAAVTAGHEGV